MALTTTEVSQLYVSIFNRVAEKSGTETWIANGGSAAAIADLMLATDAAKAYFGTSLDTNEAFVEHIYNTTLNKGGADVDAAGKLGWVEYLNAGNSKGTMVDLLIQAVAEYEVGGAKFATADQATKDAAQQFVNRVAVSDDAAATIAAVETGSTATFATTLAFGTGGLTVTADDATVVTAKAAVATEATAQAALISTANMTPAEVAAAAAVVAAEAQAVIDAAAAEAQAVVDAAAQLVTDAQVAADAKLAEAATEAQAVLDAAAKVITDAADAVVAAEAAAEAAVAAEAAAVEAAAVEAAAEAAAAEAAAAVAAAEAEAAAEAAAEAQAVIDAAAAEAQAVIDAAAQLIIDAKVIADAKLADAQALVDAAAAEVAAEAEAAAAEAAAAEAAAVEAAAVEAAAVEAAAVEAAAAEAAAIEAATPAAIAAAAAAVLTTGLAAIDAAQDAVTAFNDENPDIGLSAAQTNYDTEIDGDTVSDVATDSAALAAAYKSDVDAANSATLTGAQTALAEANAEIADTAGLTAAVVAESAAAAFADATGEALGAADDASTIVVATTSAVLFTNVDTVIAIDDMSTNGIEITTNGLGTVVLAELDADTGRLVLADASEDYTDAGLALFTEHQATVADALASINAELDANDQNNEAGEALAAATATVNYLDVDADIPYVAALEAMGGGFTLTTVADADSPLEAEVLAEIVALDAANTAADVVKVGTLANKTAADANKVITANAATAAGTADTTAGLAVTEFDILVATLDAAIVAADGSTDVTDAYAALTAYDGVAFPVIGDSAEATIIAADVADIQPAVVLEVAALAAAKVITAADSVTAIAVDALADDAVTAADTADGLADTDVTDTEDAVNDFGILVTAHGNANDTSPLTASLDGLDAAVEDAEDVIIALADAVTALAVANAATDELAVLNEALDDANATLTDADYNIVTVDGAAEFATAAADVFLVGAIDSDIYSLAAGDVISIGTDYTLNADEVAGDNGVNSVLEAWITQDGLNTVVTLETTEFSSNSAEAETTITLIGVTSTDATLAGGFISIA